MYMMAISCYPQESATELGKRFMEAKPAPDFMTTIGPLSKVPLRVRRLLQYTSLIHLTMLKQETILLIVMLLIMVYPDSDIPLMNGLE